MGIPTGDESILEKVRRGRVALARANGSSMTSHHKELEPIVQRRKRFGASTRIRVIAVGLALGLAAGVILVALAGY
jgi:hypothetical protein